MFVLAAIIYLRINAEKLYLQILFSENKVGEYWFFLQEHQITCGQLTGMLIGEQPGGGRFCVVSRTTGDCWKTGEREALQSVSVRSLNAQDVYVQCFDFVNRVMGPATSWCSAVVTSLESGGTVLILTLFYKCGYLYYKNR